MTTRNCGSSKVTWVFNYFFFLFGRIFLGFLFGPTKQAHPGRHLFQRHGTLRQTRHYSESRILQYVFSYRFYCLDFTEDTETTFRTVVMRSHGRESNLYKFRRAAIGKLFKCDRIYFTERRRVWGRYRVGENEIG